MKECECLAGCPFFNEKMANMPAMAGMMKKNYCKGNFDSCARHIVFKELGKEAVPLDLYPNQTSRVEEILGSVKA